LSSTIVRQVAAESFVIEGGHPLGGRVRAAGNKNGALPILAACLLTDEPVRLSNVPRIRDVETMTELLADVGADVDWTGTNEVRIHAAGITKHELDEELCRQIRASFLLAGPLLARLGRVRVPPPGGDSTRTSTPSPSWASRSRSTAATTWPPTRCAARRSSSTRRA
jgi:UDP-N-acetylglucosamine enolpyruvyl transferase